MNILPTGSSEPQVDVIVVNYNAGRYLDACLAALLRQTYSVFRAFIVDNASTDGSFERCQELFSDPRLQYHRFEGNLGFAVANNRAAALGRAPWIATLNPDAIADPDWLATLMEATQRYPDVEMFGSTQIDALNPQLLDGTGDQYFAGGLAWRGGFGHPVTAMPPEGETFAPCAAAALYKRTGFEALGGFDERYFCYMEDVDLAFRWRLNGGRSVQVPNAKVHHVGGATSGGGRSDFARFYGTRNLVWTFVKNMPGPLFWILLPAHILVLMLLLVIATTRQELAPTWRGLRAATIDLGAVWTDRRLVQRQRRASLCAITRALIWSPFPLLRRKPISN